MKKDYTEELMRKFERLEEKVRIRGFQYEDMDELMLFCNTINAHLGIIRQAEVVRSDDLLQQLVIFPKDEKERLYAAMLFAQGAISLLTNQLRQTSWVSCDKRMPRIGSEVLVSGRDNGGFPVIGTAIAEVGGFTLIEDSVAQRVSEIEAWMPLPAPWAGEEDDIRR